LFPIWAAAAALLAVLASAPFVEAGFNDDWGYAHIALNLAKTGHFYYGNLSVPTLLFQAYWGSALIHLFGFSFQLLRFSTLPFAMGCGVLCYRIARMAGLPAPSALFASVALVTSPLFTPLAASFMTDVYGCFFTLLAIYLGALAGRESLTARKICLWLTASTVAGYVGGLDRQLVYIASGSVLLWAIWNWRREGTILITAVGLLAALCGGALLVLQWQAQQPDAMGMKIYTVSTWRKAAIFPGQAILTLALLILPAIAGFGKARTTLRLYAISSASVAGGFTLYWRLGHHLLFPWMTNLILPVGILPPGIEMRGSRPVVLGQEASILITVVVLAALVHLGAMLLGSFRMRVGDFLQAPAAVQLIGLFGAAYFVTLVFISRDEVFDRYLLPLLPIALIAILLLNRTPALSNWIVLAIFALYGVATTHDYFSELQARVTAFQNLRAIGIEERHISGGVELDGWTQAKLKGKMFLPPKDAIPGPNEYWLARLTPAIDPHYMLSWSVEPGTALASLPAVSFVTWLPPFRREVKILVPEN